MKFSVGQKIKYIGKVLDGQPSVWTNGKIYTIHSISIDYGWGNQTEYHILRDDNQMGLWWELEMKGKFISLKEERKLKLKKIGYERTNH